MIWEFGIENNFHGSDGKILFLDFYYLAIFASYPYHNQQMNAKSKKPEVYPESGYADVNGIKLYYEIYGNGRPLVLIHGGGSTIHTSFGRIIPELENDFKLMALELQNHGRSGHRNIPETFEQDADDVVALLHEIGIKRASFFGFSNGGQTVLQIAIRHSQSVDKLVVASAGFKRNSLVPGFFEGMKRATLKNMPMPYQKAFLKLNPDPAALQNMFEKDRDRMLDFKDFDEDSIKAISSPTLIINADQDVILPESALELYRLIPHSKLMILPGGHGACLGELLATPEGNEEYKFVAQVIKGFLKA